VRNLKARKSLSAATALIFMSTLMFPLHPGDGPAEAGGEATQPVGNLEVGDRVVDSSWEWEFRTGNNYEYQHGDETAPVTWIVVADNHYDVEDGQDHVTLLAEDLVCLHAFDDSTDREGDWGSNHWGESGTTDAQYGIRPFLNSRGNNDNQEYDNNEWENGEENEEVEYAGEGFYSAFGEDFREAVVTTEVPNDDEEEGMYVTEDKVFLPSTTEYGDEDHDYTEPIGEVYPYFEDTGKEERITDLAGEPTWYWTRSPHFSRADTVRGVNSSGSFTQGYASTSYHGVRPALNVKADTLVSEFPNAEGEYEMFREVEAPEREVSRVYGMNRYETAVEISKADWDSSEAVVLARGDDFPDALAGVPLAYELDAPILLTRTDEFMEVTKEEIERLGAGEVYLLGGEAAISAEVENILVEEMGLEVERLGGDNRYHTAALIADMVAPEGTDEVAVVYGVDFVDALIGSPYAAVEGKPVLLTREESIPEHTGKALEDLGVQRTTVVGDTDKVSDEVLNDLPDSERISVPDGHYSSAVEAARHYEPTGESMYIATGMDFADALAGGVLAARDNGGIMLVGHFLPSEVENYLVEKAITEVTIFGGEQAVIQRIEDELSR